MRVAAGEKLPEQGGGQVHAVVEALASPRLGFLEALGLFIFKVIGPFTPP